MGDCLVYVRPETHVLKRVTLICLLRPMLVIHARDYSFSKVPYLEREEEN